MAESSPAAARGRSYSLMAEASIRVMARNLGVALPGFTASDRPQLFEAWADRVIQANSRCAAGLPIAGDLDECDRQLGLPATRAAAATAAVPLASTAAVPAVRLSPFQRDLARHALGLPNGSKLSFRNHYVTGPSPEHDAWMAMCGRGLAFSRKGSPISGGEPIFWLSIEGAQLALDAGERLRHPERLKSGRGAAA